MGHRLDFALVGVQRRLDQVFAVAGDAGAADESPLGQVGDQLAGDPDRGGTRVALVGAIGRIPDGAFGVQDHRLDGRGAGVDAQPDRPGQALQTGLRDEGLGVPGVELLAFSLVPEERTHGASGRDHLVGGLQLGG